MKHMHVDIETYSELDLKKVGMYKYANSLEFEILLIAYFIEGFDEVKLIDLHSLDFKREDLDEFLDHLLDPMVQKFAHNAAFERVCFEAFGWHTSPIEWTCSKTLALYAGYPPSLDFLSKVLDLGDKSKLKEGKDLIRYFCLPCKPTKLNEFRTRNLPEHNPEAWLKFGEYCKGDVVAEMAVVDKLSHIEFPSFEQDIYVADQYINDRGVRVEPSFVGKAVRTIAQHKTDSLDRMKKLTGLENPNSQPQLKKWLLDKTGKNFVKVAKDTYSEIVQDAADVLGSDSNELELIESVLDIKSNVSKTSVSKFKAMQGAYMNDFRIRGMFIFYGANRTGRYTSSIVQLHNLPRNVIQDTHEDMALTRLRSDFMSMSYEEFRNTYDNVLSALSDLIRPAFVPGDGKLYGVADYSAIEARVLSWLADEKWRLDVFATHGKIYEASASKMFNVPLEEITKGSDLRTKGKISELALGYGGALGALQRMGGSSMGLTDAQMTTLVRLWRKSNSRIVSFWEEMNTYAINSVKYKRKLVSHSFKGITFEFDRECLTIQLPSGRKLYYVGARVESSGNRETLTYLEFKDGKVLRTRTYGGKLVENITQAIARDIMAQALVRLQRADFFSVLHVHDEIVTELDIETAEQELKIQCEIMCEDLPWAKGLVLKAEGFLTEFYKKD